VLNLTTYSIALSRSETALRRATGGAASRSWRHMSKLASSAMPGTPRLGCTLQLSSKCEVTLISKPCLLLVPVLWYHLAMSSIRCSSVSVPPCCQPLTSDQPTCTLSLHTPPPQASKRTLRYHITEPTTCPAGRTLRGCAPSSNHSPLTNISGSFILHMQLPDGFWNISQAT
jgi:hypothetical protein